jgi:two-component system nitrogen regulation response regulator GlnG
MRASPRLLIADPDPDIRITVKLYFEAKRHEVQAADGLDDVLKMARLWQPNVVLFSTEFNAARAVCETLLVDTLTGHIPIIMLLHVNTRQVRLEALEAGVYDVIPKPFDLEELYFRVEAANRLATMRQSV